MLFSTNIFIWTAVSCNCSEGTAASDYPFSWDGKSYFQVGHGLAEQTICNLWSLGCAAPAGMPAGRHCLALGSWQNPPGFPPCRYLPALSPACGVNYAWLGQLGELGEPWAQDGTRGMGTSPGEQSQQGQCANSTGRCCSPSAPVGKRDSCSGTSGGAAVSAQHLHMFCSTAQHHP